MFSLSCLFLFCRVQKVACVPSLPFIGPWYSSIGTVFLIPWNNYSFQLHYHILLVMSISSVVVLAKWLSFPNMQQKGLGGLANDRYPNIRDTLERSFYCYKENWGLWVISE
jgi:hypothetical protein